VLVKNKLHQNLLKITQYSSGQVVNELILDTKKILIGSSPSCDLIINDSSISFYHAMLIIESNGGRIIDLDSVNGVYINNEKVNSGFFSEGDAIRFGRIEYLTTENFHTYHENKIINNQDQGLNQIDEIEIITKPAKLIPKKGLVVIDDEYCDIVFNEQDYKAFDYIPALINPVPSDYIEFDENKESRNIIRNNKSKAIEVTVMSMGIILNVSYFPCKEGDIYASSTVQDKKTLQVISLDTDVLIPFCSIENNSINLLPLPNYSSRNITNGKSIENDYQMIEDDIISYERKTIQMIIKVVNAPPSLTFSPFFGRDINFQKQTAKIFSMIMGLMLLLLFVDININEKKNKKIAVIYRKMIQAPIKNISKSIADNNQNEKSLTKLAKSNLNINKKLNKTSKSFIKSKMAKIKHLSIKKKPKMKAYKFTSYKSFNSLFSNTTNISKTDLKKITANTKVGFESTNVQDTKGLKTMKSINHNSLGQDFEGKFNFSSAAFGLASKSGIDASYFDTKTIVLGSMDPELLRKILREYLPQFRHCYQKELQANEKLKGIIGLDFRIGQTGLVSKVNIIVKNSSFSKSGVGCMAGVLKLIPFPKPKGGGVVDVSQPLSFFSETEKM
jgi:hypothetical protein